jgi:phosphatidate cytidylyltransferase
MIKRLITAGVLICIFVPLVVINHPITNYMFLFVGGVLSFLASYELIRRKESQISKKYKILFSLFSFFIVILTYLSFTDILPKETYIYFFILCILISLSILLFDKESTGEDFFIVFISLTYTGLFFAMAIMLKYMDYSYANDDLILQINNSMALIYLYVIVVMTDTFAMYTGMIFGKNGKKLCLHISPKKTVIGAIGGLVMGTSFGCLILFGLGKFSIIQKANLIYVIIAIILSMIISVCVQIGDLVASKIKRYFDIKDFSNFFPGHGGVLDRFDSFIFAGSIFFITIQVLISFL